MQFYTFKRESNNFNDILSDISLKPHIATKISWKNYLMIGLKYATDDSISSYIMLKYGQDTTTLSKDYTPRPNIDYIPKRH